MDTIRPTILGTVSPTKVPALGPQRVANGDFSDGLTGWTQNTNATGTAIVVAGELVYTAPHGDYAETKQLNNSEIGKEYQVEFDVVAKVDAATFVLVYYGRDELYNGAISALPLGRFKTVAVSTHTDGFAISVRIDGQVTIDNVSVREIF